MDDELVRTVVLLAALAAAMAALLGGFVRPVAGRYKDGPHEVVLRQTTIVVVGEAQVEGGRQQFFGLALYGRARLRRYDYGGVHMSMLGFNRQQWPQLEGRAMARYRLRMAADGALVGQFYGRRFSFLGAELQQSSWARPTPRRWERA